VTGIPYWIVFRDQLSLRRTFAGPYLDDEARLLADEARLVKADHTDVEIVRSRDVARWMPPLKIEAGRSEADARSGNGLLRIAADWDTIATAFEGQKADVIVTDGHALDGVVTGIDVAGRFIWVWTAC
jgi:hypothetical protein